jgi:hypothetical protein
LGLAQPDGRRFCLSASARVPRSRTSEGICGFPRRASQRFQVGLGVAVRLELPRSLVQLAFVFAQLLDRTGLLGRQLLGVRRPELLLGISILFKDRLILPFDTGSIVACQTDVLQLRLDATQLRTQPGDPVLQRGLGKETTLPQPLCPLELA